MVALVKKKKKRIGEGKDTTITGPVNWLAKKSQKKDTKPVKLGRGVQDAGYGEKRGATIPSKGRRKPDRR